MPFREAIRRLAQNMQTCEEWIEMVRDLSEPIPSLPLPESLQMRWAIKEDLFAINALQGFVKEIDFMEASLRRGDCCLLLEHEGRIRAFAWVTFHDFRLALWYTLTLPPGWSYLMYIFVHPAIGGRGVGSFLLGSLLAAVRDRGGSHMVAGMFSNWDVSIRLHTRMGFHVHRRLTQCKILNIFPTPPREG